MVKVVFMAGPAGSGKTRIAKVLEEFSDFVYIGSDEIREELWGNAADQRHPEKVFQIFYERARKAIEEGKSCVLDATFLTKKVRKDGLRALDGLEFESYCIEMVTSLEKCLLRNQMRDRQVPLSVVRRQYESFERPGVEEGFKDIVRL